MTPKRHNPSFGTIEFPKLGEAGQGITSPSLPSKRMMIGGFLLFSDYVV